MAEAIFRLKNNTLRSFGFANRLCIAGSGNPTPPEAAKQLTPDGIPFRLPPMFEMSETEMFRSFRGVQHAMNEYGSHGKAAIEVFVDGVRTPLTVAELDEWAADYRTRHNLREPKNRQDHHAEIEKAMNRPEDIFERQARLEKDQDRKDLVTLVAATVVEILKANGLTPPTATSTPPAQPQGRARPRNDEKTEGT